MSKKILIVDDEKDLTGALKTLFSESGYDTEVAQNADEAQQKLKSAFDLIILDMKMPGVDGVSLLKTINKDHPIAKVIILTGYGVEYKDKVKDLKYEKFLTKPFSAVELANTAEDALLGRKSQEDKQGLIEDPLIRPKAKLLFIDLDITYFVPKNLYFADIKQCGGIYNTKYLFVAPKIFDPKNHEEIIDEIERMLCSFRPDIVLGNQVVLGPEDGVYRSITHSKYKPKDMILYSNVNEKKEEMDFDLDKTTELIDERTDSLGRIVREVAIKNNLYEKVKEPVRLPLT